MFLNKDVFAEKNIELPSADWDKDKFLEIAQALTYEKDGDPCHSGQLHFATISGAALCAGCCILECCYW